MFDLQYLRRRCAAGDDFRYVYFWGHAQPHDGRISKACFSQWFALPFLVDDIIYPTAEHWMMASKARLFRDDDTLSKILASTDPKEAKAIGRTVRNFKNAVWNENYRQVVIAGNVAKFGQNEHLKSFLLSTGTAILVEASPDDRIWGIGLVENDPRAEHPNTWQGENWLGFALMKARELLRGCTAVYETSSGRN